MQDPQEQNRNAEAPKIHPVVAEKDRHALLYHVDGKPRFYILNEPFMTVGRSPENSLVLDKKSVSRTHFHIIYCEGRWMLQDWGSSNFTIMKGIRLIRFLPYPIEVGSSFIVSEITFTVVTLEEVNKHTDTDTEESIPFFVPKDDNADAGNTGS